MRSNLNTLQASTLVQSFDSVRSSQSPTPSHLLLHPPILQQRRLKHSNRQKKKIFRYQYYEKKRSGLLTEPEPIDEFREKEPLLWEPVFEPEFLR